MRNKGGAHVLVMCRHVQISFTLSVFASGVFEPFRNPSDGFSVFNNSCMTKPPEGSKFDSSLSKSAAKLRQVSST